MIEALQFEYMQNALMAALLGSIACGVVGSYVVVKKIGYISGGIAHSAFGGIGLGYFLGINPLYCIIPFSLVSAWCIGLISKKARAGEDTAIGILWATGMALGVIFIGLTPGYVPDLFSYLFGNILTVPRIDVYFMAGEQLLCLSAPVDPCGNNRCYACKDSGDYTDYRPFNHSSLHSQTILQ